MKRVLVLGAGVTGTTTAWYLRQAGFDVEVIERQAAAARETSFANGGQISVSHAYPWSNPGTPGKLLQWLGQADAPLLFRLGWDPQQWQWCWRFLRECSSQRSLSNMRQIVSLADYSRRSLIELRQATQINYQHLSKGILHFYTDQKEFAKAAQVLTAMQQAGCPRQMISIEQAIALEPALYAMRQQLVGADYTASDESGNVYAFTTQLANLAQQQGVVFHYANQLTRLLIEPRQRRLSGIEVIDETGHYRQLQADYYVLALGSFSPQLLKPLGLRCWIYPAKGYSATLNILAPDLAPSVSLTDDQYKLVFSRFEQQLRVAGTCEIADYDRSLNPLRCQALIRRTEELFPDACDYQNVQFWSGLRPLTPGNVPYLGQTSYPNLYLNTGHGSLGWTMAAGSAKIIRSLLLNQTPEIEHQTNWQLALN